MNRNKKQKNIPKGWQEKKLGDICIFKQGIQVDLDLQLKENKDNYIKFLRIENYTQNSNDFRFIPKTEIRKGSVINMHDIVVVRYGATAGYIARGFSGVLANNLFTIKPILEDKIFNDYLFILLKQEKTFFYLQTIMAGGAMPALSFSMLKPIKFLLPPLPEQKQIVKILETWDKCLEKLSRKIELKKNIKKGLASRIMNCELSIINGKKVYAPKVRLAGFSGEWEKIQIGKLLDYEQPTNYIVDSTDYDDNFKMPVLTAGKTFILGYTNEENNVFPKEKLPVIIFDDFTTANKYVDFSFKVKSSAMKILKNKNNDVSNINFIFGLIQLLKFKVGEHKRNYLSEYQYLDISLPSIEEQTAIAKILTTADKEIEVLEKKRKIIEEQKKYLLNNLVTGKIRIPSFVIPA